MDWHKVAESIHEFNFQENNMCVISVADKKISIGLFDNKIFAFSYKCPHASGILSNGWIDNTGNVVCPVHRYKFCMENGRNVSGEGYYLKTFPIEIRENGVYIGIENKNFFSFLKI
ncbi:MAG: Rieske 2Fe-2S domain-containing protein [Chitinophagaceae bacterium]|nr:Rieske 2Fe-2S domain-containing protein [Chitinophagaceae bacterium]MCW5904035.1 Rieske 2Fe-2S domain-containing protein [Chitinophagaceae bacterium]